MPCIPGRKGRRESGLEIGEAGIGVRHDQPNITYNIIRVIHNLWTDNVLILHKYFVISCTICCTSAVLKC